MTLKLLPVLLVALGASSVNAADVVKVSEQNNAPAILNSVQSDSVQVLSKADAAKVRGEYNEVLTGPGWRWDTEGYYYTQQRQAQQEYGYTIYRHNERREYFGERYGYLWVAR